MAPNPPLALRPYQRDDVARLQEILSRHRAAFLFHEPRVGKLIELIGLLQAQWPKWKKELEQPGCTAELAPSTLIVAPLSTLLNVQAEFERWLGWSVRINPAAPVWSCDVIEWRQPPIVAINKEKLRDASWWGFSAHWDLAFVDEAHWFRSHRAQQTGLHQKLHAGLAKLRTEKLILSTGTPVMNGLPREVYPLLALADRKAWPSYWKFLQTYACSKPSAYGSGPVDESAPWRKGMRQQLQEYLTPQTLRREYDRETPRVPKVLPIKLSDFDEEHQAAYDTLKEEWLAEIDGQEVVAPTALALTTRLAQLAATPRNVGIDRDGGLIGALLDYLDGRSGKVVVFCWHKAAVEAVAARLEEAGRPVVAVTGDTPVAERQRRVSVFQATRSDTALVCNWALAEGITLDTAGEVIFFERSWVPAQNDQAAARAPDAPVTILVPHGTILEDKEKVLSRKDKAVSAFLAMSEVIAAARKRSA